MLTRVNLCRYSGESGVDLAGVFKQSSTTTPILIMYTSEKEVAEKTFFKFANKKQTSVLVVTLSGSGAREEKIARKTLQKAMHEVM